MYVCMLNTGDKVTLIFREVIEITKEMIMVMQKRNVAIRPSLAIIQVNGTTL